MAFTTIATEAKSLEGQLLETAEKIPVNPGDRFTIEVWTDTFPSDYVLKTLKGWKDDLIEIFEVGVRDHRIRHPESGEVPDKPPEMGDYVIELDARYTDVQQAIAVNPALISGVVTVLKTLAWLGISYAVTKLTHYATSKEGGEQLAETTEKIGGAVSSTALKTTLPILAILLVAFVATR
jgi:hypothetical protein